MKAVLSRISILQAVLLVMVVGFGLLLRVTTLWSGVSFWSDEALTSSFALVVVDSPNQFSQVVEIFRTTYQPLHILEIAASFALFGPSEGAARLFPALWGSAAVFFVILFVSQISTMRAGLLAGVLVATSQLLLSQTTQAKPYAAIHCLLFLLLWLFTLLKQSNYKPQILALMFGVVILSGAHHILGSLLLIIWAVACMHVYGSQIRTFVTKPRNLLLGIFLFLGAAYFSGMIQLATRVLFTPGMGLFSVNNLPLLKSLLLVHYAWLGIPAVVGLLMIRKKNFPLFIAIVLWMGVLIYSWTFIQYSRNIRYLVPFFGVLFAFLPIFWDRVLTWAFPRFGSLLLVLVTGSLIVGTNKFVYRPQKYYSPNADFFADVQNADYKRASSWLKETYPDLNSRVLVNDVFDSEQWYLNRTSNAYFSKSAHVLGSHIHAEAKVPVYGTVEELQQFIQQNPSGIFIVEDWESFLPEDVKRYVKENFTEEYRVDCLSESPSDCWPLAIYSWDESHAHGFRDEIEAL